MVELFPDQSVVVIVDWQEKLAAVMPPELREHNLRKACILVQGARAAGVPILLTEQYPKGLGHTVPELREALGDAQKPIEKRDFAATALGTFKDALQATGRSHVVLAGMESHICVYQTARGLLDEGYVVHVAMDAVLSRAKADWRAAMALCAQCGCVTTSVEAVLFDWAKKGEGPLFKEVSRLVR
jgi:nicotinamidase-related amidase